MATVDKDDDDGDDDDDDDDDESVDACMVLYTDMLWARMPLTSYVTTELSRHKQL